MARGRMISIQVASDPDLNRLSAEAERLYLRTLPHLDRDGLITGHPMLLWAKVAPLRIELMDACSAMISEWVQQGLVIRYAGADNQPVLYFKGFRRHNANIPYTDEAPSIYPPPPGWTRGKFGLVPEDEEQRFRVAAAFDPRSKYRQELETTTVGRDQVETRSRLGRDQVEYQVQDQDQGIGGGGVQEHSSHPLGYGNGGGAGGGAPTRLTQALAEYSDDELRIGADNVASLHNFPTEFNGWARFISAATRQDLILILAWCIKWKDLTLEEMERIHSWPALLRSKLRNTEWPGLTTSQIAALANLVQDALFALVPEAEL